jgi:acyl transferase domain-containing protein
LILPSVCGGGAADGSSGGGTGAAGGAPALDRATICCRVALSSAQGVDEFFAGLAELVVGGADAQAIARTLMHGRSRDGRHRALLIARDSERLPSIGHLGHLLRAIGDGQQQGLGVWRGERARVPNTLWVFTGMGAQYVGMGAALLDESPAYRAAVDEVDSLFARESGWSLLEEMRKPEAESRMASNWLAQPANLLLQVGVTAALRAAGLAPDGIIGDSVGEVAAAWACGALSLEQAVRLSYHRSQIQQRAAGRGSMVAVGVTEAEAREIVAGCYDVSVAAVNGPTSVTLAGARAELEGVLAACKARGVFAAQLRVEVAYHHEPHMGALRDAFFSALAGLTPAALQLPLFSTKTGAAGHGGGGPLHDASYWWANACQPVLLQSATRSAHDEGYNTFVEIGPHPVLAAAIRENAAERGKQVETHHTCHRKQPRGALDRAFGTLFVSGAEPDWSAWLQRRGLDGEAMAEAMPPYPFQRVPMWTHEPAARGWRCGPDEPTFGLLGLAEPAQPNVHMVGLDAPRLAFLRDHRVQGSIVFPAAGYVDAMCSAALAGSDSPSLMLVGVAFKQGLVVDHAAQPRLRTANDRDSGLITVGSLHADGTKWETNATATVVAGASLDLAADEGAAAMEIAAARGGDGGGTSRALGKTAIYNELAARGLQYGPCFQGLESVRKLDRATHGAPPRAVASIVEPAGAAGHAGVVHPSVLDAAFQAAIFLVDGAAVPVAIGEL